MEQADKIIGRLPGGLSLNNVAEVLGIEREGNSHRAESDARLAARVAEALWAGKRPYGAENIALEVVNEMYSLDTGSKIRKPKLRLGIEHPLVLMAIQRNADCHLWTSDDVPYINIYGPDGEYGKGVLARIYKDENPEFYDLYLSGEDIGVWVEKPFPEWANYELHFAAGEPDFF